MSNNKIMTDEELANNARESEELFTQLLSLLSPKEKVMLLRFKILANDKTIHLNSIIIDLYHKLIDSAKKREKLLEDYTSLYNAVGKTLFSDDQTK